MIPPTSDADRARDLAADLALCDMATPGPWYHDHNSMWGCVTTQAGGAGTPVLEAKNGVVECQPIHPRANASFAARAREGWPTALRLLAEARAELERLRAELAHFAHTEELS